MVTLSKRWENLRVRKGATTEEERCNSYVEGSRQIGTACVLLFGFVRKIQQASIGDAL